MQQNIEPKTTDFILLLMLATIWASSFGVMKFLVADISPLTISALRTGIGGLIILPFIIGKQLPSTRKEWLLVVGIAVFGNALPFTLIPLGETKLDSGLAGMLMAVGPVFALIFNHLFTKDDRATRRKILGVAIGLFGTAIIFGEAIFTGNADQAPYIAFIIMATISYVFGGLMIRPLAHLPLTVLTGLCLLIASCITAPIPYILNIPYIYHVDQETLYAITYLGAIPTAVAFSIRFLLIRRTGYTFFSYVGYIIPAISLILGAIFLSEIPTVEKIIALCFILFGLSLFRKPSKPQ